ncbi:hypothetical protein CFOL_v3_28571 [Cephalotus follicularis]|uniref:Exo_endo_phos domain-containing protein n=1 Tax=Cephalotus follicularis TaxID=3775 RepID=A0A1Q3CYK9_CEPFO|nr:hypothetical protein CFOL_v3_28571 [Cephalotus follicularis]
MDILFPRAYVMHEVSSISDHCPVLLSLDANPTMKQGRRRVTRFEAMWVKDMKCEEIMKESWHKGRDRPGAYGIITKIQRCRDNLSKWSRESVGSITNPIREKKNGSLQI